MACATGISATSTIAATSRCLLTVPTLRSRNAMWPSRYSAGPAHSAIAGTSFSGSSLSSSDFLVPSASRTIPAIMKKWM